MIEASLSYRISLYRSLWLKVSSCLRPFLCQLYKPLVFAFSGDQPHEMATPAQGGSSIQSEGGAVFGGAVTSHQGDINIGKLASAVIPGHGEILTVIQSPHY